VVTAETFVVLIRKVEILSLVRRTGGKRTVAAGSLLDTTSDIPTAAGALRWTYPLTNTGSEGFIGLYGGGPPTTMSGLI
jgi:hypothetical protein